MVNAGSDVNQLPQFGSTGLRPLDQALSCARRVYLEFDEVTSLSLALENPSCFPFRARAALPWGENVISQSDIERVVAIESWNLAKRKTVRGDLLENLREFDVTRGCTLFLVEVGSVLHQIINFLQERGADSVEENFLIQDQH